MSDLKESTVAVKEHLRSMGFATTTRALDIDSRYGEVGVVTTVRIANRANVWSQDFADSLKVALRDLPGHPYVHLSEIRDLVTVVWDGEPEEK